MLSKSCTYGIWAVLYLSSVEDREYVPIREISHSLEIPFHFLTKILQLLAKAKIVETLRGSRGGVQLFRPPEQISLRDVIESIDGNGLFNDCVMGLPKCGEDHPCPLHSKWSEVQSKIREISEQTSFLDLAQRAKNTTWLNNDLLPDLGTMFTSQ